MNGRALSVAPKTESTTVEFGRATLSAERVRTNAQIVHPTVSIIIPAKNEARNLPYVLPHLPHWAHEVILVDGNSSDGTAEVAKLLCERIQVVQQKGRGKGAALRTGFALATGDIIVMLDADGSMNPGEIPAYLGVLLTGADVAKGSRFLQGGGTHDMGRIRYAGNLFLTWLLRLLHGGQYSDLCYGYNAFWRRVLAEIKLDADGFEIETQLNVRILQAGLRIHEVPSFEAGRIHGDSNLNAFRDGWRVFKTIVGEWFLPRVERLHSEEIGTLRLSTPQPLSIAASNPRQFD
ncbi:MAG: glycosyltransferase family 2 protein [Caldilineaceae bacterium]